MNLEPDHTLATEKQAGISLMLIIGIMIITGFYMTCTPNSEDESIIMGTFAFPILTVLIGLYTFTYRGKAYIFSRVLFFIFLAISLFSLFVLWYFIELGHAYSH